MLRRQAARRILVATDDADLAKAPLARPGPQVLGSVRTGAENGQHRGIGSREQPNRDRAALRSPHLCGVSSIERRKWPAGAGFENRERTLEAFQPARGVVGA